MVKFGDIRQEDSYRVLFGDLKGNDLLVIVEDTFRVGLVRQLAEGFSIYKPIIVLIINKPKHIMTNFINGYRTISVTQHRKYVLRDLGVNVEMSVVYLLEELLARFSFYTEDDDPALVEDKKAEVLQTLERRGHG